jgi:TubC N-terminal docking domain
MATSALLSELRSAGLTVSANGGRVIVAPKERLTDAMRASIKASKLDLLADLEREATTPVVDADPAQTCRQRQVLAALISRPDIRFAFLADSTPTGEGIITLGIRNVGTGELRIPADRYDPLAVMRLLDDVAAGRA